MLVYDITNYSSFENLDDWLSVIQQECFKDDIKPPHLALVANKSVQPCSFYNLFYFSRLSQWIWSI